MSLLCLYIFYLYIHIHFLLNKIVKNWIVFLAQLAYAHTKGFIVIDKNRRRIIRKSRCLLKGKLKKAYFQNKPHAYDFDDFETPLRQFLENLRFFFSLTDSTKGVDHGNL